tara:strand:- start:1501 stop:2235 length:735 start_codon:yes stop_codon:yes gene_type:complete
MKVLLFLSPFIAIGILYYVKTRMQDKHRPYVLGSLWFLTLVFASLLFTSIYDEIKFDEVKNERYQFVIKNLKDIRDTQLAHRTVKGFFQDNWDSLVKFVEVDSFTITQRRDSSVLDKEMTKRYGGVKTFKDIIIVDTLGFVSVKDSLFGFDDRYINMMYVPYSKDNKTKFNLDADFLNQNGINIPVFEAFVKKRVILHDQPLSLVLKENQVQSVDGVNGSTLKIGSMNEVNTNGNWPKNYTKDN